MGQAARIYDPEALTVVEEIIDRNVSIMGDEQLQHIVLRGDQ